MLLCLYDKRNNTCLLLDMEFRFLCSTRSTSHSLAALTREVSSRTFEEKFHISTRTRVLFSISLLFFRGYRSVLDQGLEVS